jgi:L-ascorbate metabolism protein UlaG (beta-lactamase superfamily)
MSVRSWLAAVVLALGAMPAAHAQSGKTELLWLGQAAFRIITPGGKVIMTDPRLLRNPRTPAPYKDLAALGKVDVVLVTHGHLDHIADAPALARLNNIPMYAPGDLNQTLTLLGVLPPEQLPRFNKGGTVRPAAGIKVTATRAEHSSVYVWSNPATGKAEAHVGGEPIGFIIDDGEWLQDLSHGRYRRVRRHEAHRRALQARCRPHPDRRQLHHGPRRRGLRDARVPEA